MQDMIDLLGSLREQNTVQPASPETVAADVARARRTQARRRTVGTAVVAAVAAVTVGAVATAGGARTAAVASAPSTSHQQALSVQLDAYTGAQPAGFIVSTVPSGWTVRTSNPFAFVVEPPNSSYRPATPDGVNFENAISVLLLGDSNGPSFDVTSVTVNGHPGKLGLTSDRTAEWLVYSDGSGPQVLVQVPLKIPLADGQTVHLTNAQILQFASGITVTGAAQAGKG